MSTAAGTIHNLKADPYLTDDLRYCYVDSKKVPYVGTTLRARPNVTEDFVPLDKLDEAVAENFAGIGVSVQASKICAIDVDHCFKEAFNFKSIDDRGKKILDIFKDVTYAEFSFSGTGMRILFKADPIERYSEIYYVKNSKSQIEYYYPEGSYRYVTITGVVINDCEIGYVEPFVLFKFLEGFMKRPEIQKIKIEELELLVDVDNTLLHYLRTDRDFQDNWFDKAPGSGSNESERDFFLCKFIYDHITHDKDKVKEIFESSPFFKSKDKKHIYKWKRAGGWYFNYLYDSVRR